MIKFPDKIGSNNISEFALIDISQVSGSRYVNTLNTTGTTLYTIPDSLLSSSGTGSDAIGQCWFVTSLNKKYYLTSWVNRRNSSGWVSESFFQIGTTSGTAFDGASGITLSNSITTLGNRISGIESLYTISLDLQDITLTKNLKVNTIEATNYVGNFTSSLDKASYSTFGIANFNQDHFYVTGGSVSLSSDLIYNLNESVSQTYVSQAITTAIAPKWTTDTGLINNWNYSYNYINTNQSFLDAMISADLNILSYFHIDANNRIYTELDFYSLGEVAAFGMSSGNTGTTGTTGYTGTSVNLLYNWGDYTPEKFNYATSALLGVDLNTRIASIESGSTTNLTNLGSGNGVTLIAKSGNNLTVTYANFSLSGHTHSEYQPSDLDLTAIAGLSATSGILRKTAVNTWALDTNTYLTSNQTITLSGDVVGSGITSISTSIGATNVTAKLLTNYVTGTNTGITSSDSILSAFGKLQSQMNARPGTVTSVGMSVPTGFAVTPSSVTSAGTFAISYSTGYSMPTTANQSNWSSAYIYSQIGHLPLSGGTLSGEFVVPKGGRFGSPNSDNPNKYGLSFRSDWSATNPWVGMYFGATLSSGTHGSVIGNAAMYFTMDDTTNRGWIFRQNFTGVEQNVASISNTGNITASGEITAYSASDFRLKENVVKLENSLSLINKFEPVSFDWNKEAIKLNSLKGLNIKDFGFIAQEVEQILPEIVHNIYGEYKSIDYIKFIPFLVSAIKELTEMVNELKNKGL